MKSKLYLELESVRDFQYREWLEKYEEKLINYSSHYIAKQGYAIAWSSSETRINDPDSIIGLIMDELDFLYKWCESEGFKVKAVKFSPATGNQYYKIIWGLDDNVVLKF